MTVNAEGPAVLIDLSNVCRDEGLRRPGRDADLSAFARIHRALTQAPWIFGRVWAIADRNLKHFFEADEREQYEALVRAKIVTEAPVADVPLFQHAFGEASPLRGAVIVSMDNYADFRRIYPEVQGSTDRFIGWRVEQDRRLAIYYRDMGEFTHNRMSRKEEEGEFKGNRIMHADVRDRAVTSRYRCINPTCDLARAWPNGLQELPVYDRKRDDFGCPSCGRLLDYLGSRKPAAQLIVIHDGAERRRILVDEGASLVFGRADQSGSVVGPGDGVPSEASARISREHLRISLLDGILTVDDLGSKNGSVVEERRGSRSRPLRVGDPVALDARTRIRLPGGILLERSGRQNPFGGDDPVSLGREVDPSLLEPTVFGG